ncbi:recombinase [Amycolatopsis camponoti]|uniref:Recombinase n=1 Tax=Amycolatopsis camponoti TaxID=2606593 RepID=A0A6I8M1C1_9PSEU|nr:recombinase family protein [Amycolatopsis camponoti]VVJ22677.1 recombinase [Amycolatopsis camponoti]
MPARSTTRRLSLLRRWARAIGHRLTVRHQRSPNRTGTRHHVGVPQHPVTRRSAEALAALIRAGWNVHHPPYGYTTMTVGEAAASRRGNPRTRLTPDPRRALVVQAIFYWRAVTGLSVERITARLDADPDRYPPPGTHTSWPPTGVTAILTNLKYTGYQAVGTRDEHGALRPAEHWVLSDLPAHRALITPALFWAAQSPATSVRRIPHRLLTPDHDHTTGHNREETP